VTVPAPQSVPHQESGPARPTPSGPVPATNVAEAPMGSALVGAGALAVGAAALWAKRRRDGDAAGPDEATASDS